MGEKVKVTDYELSEDLQEFTKYSLDVQYLSPEVKNKIDSLKLGTMVKVEKEIGSPIKILDVNEVNDALIEADFF